MADTGTGTTFTKAARRKSAPVRRVPISLDARQKYEAAVRERDEREKLYGQHLAPEDKGKR